MMNEYHARMNATRAQEIEQRLTAAFSPTRLEIIDESHKHAGHAGATSGGGGGHFIVTISSPSFDGVPLVKQHRMIYAALDDMMNSDIHALKINVV